MSETPEQSDQDDDQFFRLAVNSATFGNTQELAAM